MFPCYVVNVRGVLYNLGFLAMQDGDIFNQCVMFGDFSPTGDDVDFTPCSPSEFTFDLTTSFGYPSATFTTAIDMAKQNGALNYAFHESLADIACPHNVSKKEAKQLLEKVSFGTLKS